MNVSDSDAKIDRAQENLNALAGEIRGVIDKKPYRLIEQFDLHVGEESKGIYRYVISDLVPVPARWNVIIGEIVHDMRSALDYLAWGAARRPWSKTQFPIFTAESDWDTKVGPMIKTIPAECVAIFKEAQPHRNVEQGRDPLLHWLAILNHLSNRDKHHLLNTTLLTLNEAAPGFSAAKDIAAVHEIVLNLGPMKNGATLVYAVISTDGPEPEMNMDGEFVLDVAFSDTSARGKRMVDGEAVGRILEGIGRYVNKIVRRFEVI